MNPEILTGPLAQAIGWALLHLLWQGAIVAGILAASLALLKKRSANVRYAVSCAALPLVLVLGIVTAFQAYEPVVRFVPATSGLTIPMTSTAAIVATVAKLTWRDRLDALGAAANDALPLVVALWLAGVVLLSSRLLITWLRTQRMAKGDAVPADARFQRAAMRLSGALGLRRAVRLLESAAVEVPSVIGFVRPVILLPASTLTGLTPEQIEMILAHELAHIRRHDFFVNLLQAVVETLMFYHPAVWWMSRRVRIERENCCDDLAVAVCGNPLQYARALTRLEELRADELQIAVSSNGGSLLDRIKRIAGGRPEAEGLTSRWAAGLAVLTIVAISLAAPSLPAFAQREKEVKKADSPKSSDSRVEVRATEDDDDWAPEPPDMLEPPEMAEMPEIPEPPDIPMPMIAPRPAFRGVPMPVPAMAPMAPMPPMAPMTPMAAPVAIPAMPAMPAPPAVPQIAGMDLDFDFDFDFDQDESSGKSAPRADGKLSVDELVELRVHGVTPAYISEMRVILPGVSVKEIAGMRAVGVTPAFVREMRDAGLEVKTPRDAQGLAAVGVTAKYVREMRAAGLEVKSSRDAQSLAAVGVTPEYLSQIRSAGVAINTAREAQSLRAMGVTAAFVKQLSDAGYKNLSVKDLTRLAAAGVDGDFIREMAKYKTN